MSPKLKPLRWLCLGGALVAAACGSEPIPEGVAGPFLSLPPADTDLTRLLENPAGAIDRTQPFYVQAVVSGAETGDIVLAQATPGGAAHAFEALRPGGVGLLFRFDDAAGATGGMLTVSVTIVNKDRQIGSIQFPVNRLAAR